MTDPNQLPFERREEILAICAEYGVTNVRVFGSVARGEATAESDLDLLVDYPKGLGLRFFGLEGRLSDALKFPVQLVPDNSIHPRMKDNILSDARPL